MVFKSKLPEVEIPEISLTDFLLNRVAELEREHGGEEFRKKVMTKCGVTNRTVTFGNFADWVPRIARHMHHTYGYQQRDVFSILAPNMPEYPVIFHGLSFAGMTVTTINPLYTVEETARQLDDSRAKAMFTIPQLWDKAVAACVASETCRTVFFLRPSADVPLPEHEGITVHDAMTLLAPIDKELNVQINVREDVVMLPYSSGTTAAPKGVMLTHYNIIANIHQIAPLEHFSSDDVLIGILPFFHLYALVIIVAVAISSGASVITMPRFDLETFLRLIQEYKITRMHLVPPIILALAKHPLVERFDLSSIKVIVSGAAPLSSELAEACQKRLGVVIKQGYGMTELSPVTHLGNEEVRLKPASIGWLVPNTEAKLVDPETGEEVTQPHREGELCIRGPQVMKGYLNKPDETAHCIRNGWMHTGDVCIIDEDEDFFVVDRVKELIKFKGFQVAPAQLEGVLISHPAVADAAVIPSPDEEAGEVPKAFVVLKAGQAATADDLVAYVGERVAPHKKIRMVEFINEIPKSASGKILRRVLVLKEREAVAATKLPA